MEQHAFPWARWRVERFSDGKFFHIWKAGKYLLGIPDNLQGIGKSLTGKREYMAAHHPLPPSSIFAKICPRRRELFPYMEEFVSGGKVDIAGKI